MVPIQTILALLTVLALMSGCSQNAPPGSTWKPKAAIGFTPGMTNLKPNSGGSNKQDSNANGNGTPINSGAVTKVPEFYVESSRMTKYIVTPNGATDWTIQLKGIDAIHAYLVMPIYPKLGENNGLSVLTKVGKRFSCERSMVDTACVFHLLPNGGEIDVVEAEPKLGPAEVKLSKIYENLSIRIDPFGKIAPTGLFNVTGEDALEIYSNLVVPEVQLPSGKDYFQKKGKRVDCYRTGKTMTVPESIFNCVFYVNFSIGDIDEIKI